VTHILPLVRCSLLKAALSVICHLCTSHSVTATGPSVHYLYQFALQYHFVPYERRLSVEVTENGLNLPGESRPDRDVYSWNDEALSEQKGKEEKYMVFAAPELVQSISTHYLERDRAAGSRSPGTPSQKKQERMSGTFQKNILSLSVREAVKRYANVRRGSLRIADGRIKSTTSQQSARRQSQAPMSSHGIVQELVKEGCVEVLVDLLSHRPHQTWDGLFVDNPSTQQKSSHSSSTATEHLSPSDRDGSERTQSTSPSNEHSGNAVHSVQIARLVLRALLPLCLQPYSVWVLVQGRALYGVVQLMVQSLGVKLSSL